MSIQHRTIRIFISSTFRDMHSERDHLVKYIFPELREKCLKKGIHLVDIDLRWGVTEKEAEEGKALEICLDEIDNCKPYFIGLLGERYGWAPETYEVSQHRKFDWLRNFEQGHSITALEIYQGVLNNQDTQPRAFFYFRDPAFIKDVPASKQTEVASENPEATSKLFHLKENIKDVFRMNKIRGHITDNYPCSYKGIRINWAQVKADSNLSLNEKEMQMLDELAGTDNLIVREDYSRLSAAQRSIVDKYGVVYLDGLETFGQKVLEDIWGVIQTDFPDNAMEKDPLDIEWNYHENFLEQRTRLFLGRDDILGKMKSYLSLNSPGKPLYLIGAAGSGKSAIMARAVKDHRERNPQDITIARFVGASPLSSDIYNLLHNITLELARQLKIEADEEQMRRYDTLVNYFRNILEQVAQNQKVLLAIDALNQLTPSFNPQHLSWLPTTLPSNIKIIVSSLEGDYAASARRYDLLMVVAESLGRDTAMEIVTRKLGEYRKSLSPRQMDTLLEKDEAVKPLYITVACEELRTFPRFEEIDNRIAGLPHTIPLLFDQVLEQLEKDHGRKLVNDALGLLECSMHGLLEDELLEMIRMIHNGKIPANKWARLFRSISPYLSNAGENKEGMINFFHQQLSFAARKRYLTPAMEKRCYTILAVYGYNEFFKDWRNLFNTKKYCGIYLYKSGSKKEFAEVFNMIFDMEDWTGNIKEPAHALFHYLINFEPFDNRKEFEDLIATLKSNVGICARVGEFFRDKGYQYLSSGKSNWAMLFFEHYQRLTEEVIRLDKDNREDFHEKFAYSLIGSAIVMLRMGNSKKAVESIEKAKEIISDLLVKTPRNIKYHLYQAMIHNLLGRFQSETANCEQAHNHFHQSASILNLLHQTRPQNILFHRELLINNTDTGICFMHQGKTPQALQCFEKDLVELQKLVKTHPDDKELLKDLSIAHKNMAMTRLKERGNSVDHLQKQYEILQQLLNQEPGRTDLLREMAQYYQLAGEAEILRKKQQPAPDLILKGFEIMTRLNRAEPERSDFARDLLNLGQKLICFYINSNRPAQALPILEDCLAVANLLVTGEPARTDYKSATDLLDKQSAYIRKLAAGNSSIAFPLTGTSKDLFSYLHNDLLCSASGKMHPRVDIMGDEYAMAITILKYTTNDQFMKDHLRALESLAADARLLENLVKKEPGKPSLLYCLSENYRTNALVYIGLALNMKYEELVTDNWKRIMMPIEDNFEYYHKKELENQPDHIFYRLEEFDNLLEGLLNKEGYLNQVREYFQKDYDTCNSLSRLAMGNNHYWFHLAAASWHYALVSDDPAKKSYLTQAMNIFERLIENGHGNEDSFYVYKRVMQGMVNLFWQEQSFENCILYSLRHNNLMGPDRWFIANTMKAQFVTDQIMECLDSATMILNENSEDQEARMYCGFCFHEENDLDQALTIYLELEEEGWQDAYLKSRIADVYMDRDANYPKAIHYLQLATELDPDYTVAFNNMAWCYKQLKDYPSAIEAAENALAIDETHKNPWFHKAESHWALGQRQEAIKAMKKAKKFGHPTAGERLKEWE